MHRFVVLSLVLLLNAAASATPPSFFSPNLYDCKGEGVEISYVSAGIDGRPSISFTLGKGADRSTSSARADRVIKTPTLIGDIYSIMVRALPDAVTTYASVVIPRIHLRTVEPEDAVVFESMYISTDKKSSIGGPNFVTGLVDESTVVPVTCTAHFVHF